MISLVIKQRIILAHIDGMSNRAIANVLHLSKDTVNKYEQNPLTYTKLAFKENGLQDYMDAIEKFN